MSRPTMDELGLQMVEWYLSKSDRGTWLPDRRIGHALGWFKGGKDHPQVGYKGTLNDELRQVDIGLVRKVRGYVDRDNGLFEGYWFGTKRNGAGNKFSHLHTPDDPGPTTATDAAVVEQFASVQQADAQNGLAMERRIGELQAAQEDYTKQGQLDKAFLCHDAVRDIQTYGHILPATRAAAEKMGLAIARGRLG